MKKVISVLLSILFVIIVIAFACIGCKQTNYKNEKGYDVYISDANKGYKDIPYYNVKDSINTKEGRQYFENNSRRVGDYLITDYEEGVCINRCYRTVDGSLFSKDGKKQLSLYRPCLDYTVPSSVKVFELSNGVYDLLNSITIGKNVK